jgi:hypothetical protein
LKLKEVDTTATGTNSTHPIPHIHPKNHHLKKNKMQRKRTQAG